MPIHTDRDCLDICWFWLKSWCCGRNAEGTAASVCVSRSKGLNVQPTLAMNRVKAEELVVMC